MAATNIGTKIYFSPTVRPSRMTKAEVEAVSDWEELEGCFTNVSEIGGTVNTTEATCMASGEIVRGRGARDNGEVTFEFLWNPSSASFSAFQDLRDIGEANNGFNYLFKVEKGNAPSDTMTGTVLYLRGEISSWIITMGAAEDMDSRSFILRLAQPHIEVDPETI